MNTPSVPLTVSEAPDSIDRELEPLLAEPFASAWAAGASEAQHSALSSAVHGRLRERVAASRAAARMMHTARRSRLPAETVAPGVEARTLYAAGEGRPLRPGEPVRARLIELSPGGIWSGPQRGLHREWLVLEGSIRLGTERLLPRDYHVDPSGSQVQALGTDGGALLFLRESALPAWRSDVPFTVRDEDAAWPEFGPGIRRRVLWQREGQAALLYYARPGASVPPHTHGHDEECLMVQGELFLDDTLLQVGDYQLAPAGTGHRITETDTGVVIYAHGDLDLQFVA